VKVVFGFCLFWLRGTFSTAGFARKRFLLLNWSVLALAFALVPSSSFAFTDTTVRSLKDISLGTSCTVDISYDGGSDAATIHVQPSGAAPDGSIYVISNPWPAATLSAATINACGVTDAVLSNVKGADAGLGFAGQSYMGFEATYTRDGAGYRFTAAIREDVPGTVTVTAIEELLPTPPTVTSIVRQAPTGATTNADNLTFRVAFDQDVQNVDATGFVATGSTATVTNVVAQSASVYDVTVSGGDLANLNGSVALGFAGGQNIADLGGDALIDTNPTGAHEDYLLDNVAPTFSVSGMPLHTNGVAPFNVTFRSNEDVSFPDVVTDINAILQNAAVSNVQVLQPSRTFIIEITPTGAGDIVLNTYASTIAYDLAGNPNSGSGLYTVVLDAAIPTITSIERHNPLTEVTDADTLTWRVTMSEIVYMGDPSTWQVTGTTGHVSSVVKVGGSEDTAQVFDVTVIGGDLAGLNGQTVSINYNPLELNNIRDVAGNAATSATPTGAHESYTVSQDTVAPTLTSIVRHNPTAETTDADSLTWRVTFSEPVEGVAGDAGLWAIAGTTAAPTQVVAIGNGFGFWSEFDVTISGGDLAGLNGQVVTLSLRPTVGGSITDAVGNTVADTNPTGAHESYTVTNDNVAPTVEIQGIPVQHDGKTAFPVTVQFSEDVTYGGGFSVTNGTASGFTTVDANTYQFTITPSGYRDIVLEVAAGVATDTAGNSNTASAQVTVKSNLVEKTSLQIKEFLDLRARSIIQQQPDLIGFLDGTFERVGSPLGNLSSNFMATENGMNGEYSFSTSLNKLRQLGLEQDGFGVGANGEGQSANTKGSFDVWTELHGSLSKDAQSNADNLVASFGGHYFITPDLLIGAAAQFDWASQRDVGASSSVGGSGWMAGPYFAAKLPDQNLFVEGAASWGRSNNWISPVGTFTDSFTTDRWMVRGKISGEYEVGDFTFVPAASLTYFDETQHAYTDSLGNPIPSQRQVLGELNFGPKLVWTMNLDDGSVFSPSVGLSGISSFGANTGTRAKLDLGFKYKNPKGWVLSGDAYYDGIGQSGFDAIGGKLKLNVPLQ